MYRNKVCVCVCVCVCVYVSRMLGSLGVECNFSVGNSLTTIWWANNTGPTTLIGHKYITS